MGIVSTVIRIAVKMGEGKGQREREREREGYEQEQNVGYQENRAMKNSSDFLYNL